MLRPLKLTTPPEDLFLTSDCHFHHDRPWIVQARGFTSVAEHDSTLIARWNETVRDTSTVIHLGDLMAKSDCAGFWALVRRLRFKRLLLLLGNHPSGQKQAYTELVQRRFADLDNLQGGISAEVYPLDTHVDGDPGRTVTFLPEYVEVTVAKRDLVLCHYPLASWHGMAHSALMVHGHCHGNLAEKLPLRVDVGIECYGRPVALTQLLRETAGQTPAVVDHHRRDS